jgi:hypothetical protein
MGQLGDILEFFSVSANPFRFVRAMICERNSIEIADMADRSASKLWGRRKALAGIDAGGSHQINEKTLSVWIEKPSRFRIEERSIEHATQEPALQIVDGDCWTTRDPEGHLESGKADRCGKGPTLTEVERHFDPELIRRFFEHLSLEARGSVRTASRDCIRLHAVLRPGGSLWPHWLPKNADEYEFHADCQLSVLLALFAKYKGSIFWSSEITEVHFDEAIADELFKYTPQGYEQIRTPVPVVERLSLASAIKQMPFTVFVPSRTPGFEQARLEYMYHPARPKSPRPYLSLLFHGGSRKFLSISEGATEDPYLQEFEWEQLCQGGQEFRISDPGPGRGYRLVALKKQETYVNICSDLERELVIEVATSLVAAT